MAQDSIKLQSRIIDPSGDVRWEKFVANHPSATVYHHTVWRDFLCKTFQHMKPCYIILENTQGEIVAGIPLFIVESWITGKRLVSVPFASVCHPLVTDDEDLGTLITASIEHCKQSACSYFEMRLRGTDQGQMIPGMKRTTQYKSHVLSLDRDLDGIRKSFHKTSVQQRIRRAEKKGLDTHYALSERELEEFYLLLSKQRLRKLGLPPHPYRLFKHMWDLLKPKQMLDLHLIEHDGKMIAGMLVLKANNMVISEHAATEKKYMNIGANQLLWWKAIESAHREGFRYFDLGKSHINAHGLLAFKRWWYPQEYDIYHYYYPDVRGIYATSRASATHKCLNMLWRHMPMSLAKFGGNFLYNHMG